MRCTSATPALPGQRDGEQPAWADGERHAAHHALVDSGRAYLGYDDAGMVILDVSDITRARQAGQLRWPGGGSTHTCLPLTGRGLVAVTDEQVRDGPRAPKRDIRVIDVAGATPCVVAACPQPRGRFAELPGRFGPHNLHENQPPASRLRRSTTCSWMTPGSSGPLTGWAADSTSWSPSLSWPG